MSVQPLAWAEVDLKAVVHNLKEIKRLSAKQKFSLPTRVRVSNPAKNNNGILAVIKADGYGHGRLEVGRTLEKQGVTFFAVSDLAEGIELRNGGIQRPILIFKSNLTSQIKDLVQYQLTATVGTYAFALALNKYAKRHSLQLRIHIMVDTGMGRLGLWQHQAYEWILKIQCLRNLVIEGIYTHFPSADSDRDFTIKQMKVMKDLVVKLDRKGIVIPYIHASHSMGLGGYQTDIFNLVRPGLLIYGLHPYKKLKTVVDLKPVLSIKSKIIFLKSIEKGRSISYGRTFIAPKKMRVATIPIGYNDGYCRIFSNKAHVLISGKLCPVIGRVTMDQIVVDVSKVPSAKVGMSVTLLGQDKNKSVSADELADLANTINYEIVCGFGNRLPRIYK